MQAQFTHDVAAMHFDCGRGDVQPFGNTCRGVALGDELEDGLVGVMGPVGLEGLDVVEGRVEPHLIARGAADDVDADLVGPDLRDQPGQRSDPAGQLLGLDGIRDLDGDDVVQHGDSLAAAFYGS